MTRETGKKIIEEKISDFEKNALVLKKKGHGETNIRTNYIDVLFEALGWNMKSYYEVVREFSQKDNSATKKVDYAFKIKGKLKFFVEAKEVSVDLVNDKDAIHQAKRYAYSTNGKAPIVILTDFEEFRVFNVIKAPDYNNTDRELLKKYSMEYSDYLNNWDLLWNTFSKEAVIAGSLEVLRGKIDKNTKTMDVDFLEQITGWREDLARNIAIRNKDLKVDELNEAVQRILDRLLFIRNLEDREIEPENTLLDKTKKAENIYLSLIPIFNNLDNVYNGLLFKKHFSEELIVDDKTIKDIIKSMCYPVSPFQFDVIEPEILGRIYEKFLGSKIRLTENHQAKIEEKIEVRKAGGVYYTPEYIVHYIVENTVGKKIAGLNPEEIKKIKIVDPACGSGSFLLGAYSSLLDYHAKWYAAASVSDRKKYKADFYTTNDGELKVNLDKRGSILRDNIFGVDIDKEATEVAIMSLYLKMLDDGFDNGEPDLFFIKGHVLPDMADNIKSGNSLIGTDYFDGRLDFDIQEMKEIKPFDWDKEFPAIFKDGGFDCVIGNPPYVQASLIMDYKEYFKNTFATYSGNSDLYVFFVEKSCKLLHQSGQYGMIVSNKWLRADYGGNLRKHLAKTIDINRLIDFGELPVFQGVGTFPCIIIGTSRTNTGIETKYTPVKELPPIENLESQIQDLSFAVDLRDINAMEWSLVPKDVDKILDKINNHVIKLGNYPGLIIRRGVVTGFNPAFIVDENTKRKLIQEHKSAAELIMPFVSGDETRRYSISWQKRYVIFSRRGIDISAYPSILSHLSNWRKELEPRKNNAKVSIGRKPGIYKWYEIQDSTSYYQDFGKPKIVYGQFQIAPHFCFSPETLYFGSNHYMMVHDDTSFLYYLLGILNSKLYFFYMKRVAGVLGDADDGGRLISQKSHILKFPISTINTSETNEKAQHEKMVSLVAQMLQAQKDYSNTKSEADKKLYEQKISMLDKKIDELVYKLYGLTDEEIKIIEGE